MSDPVLINKTLRDLCTEMGSTAAGLSLYGEMVEKFYPEDQVSDSCIVVEGRNSEWKYEFLWQAKVDPKFGFNPFDFALLPLGRLQFRVNYSLVRFSTVHGLSKMGLWRLRVALGICQLLKALSYFLMVCGTILLVISVLGQFLFPIKPGDRQGLLIMALLSVLLIAFAYGYNLIENRIRVPRRLRHISKFPFTLLKIRKYEGFLARE